MPRRILILSASVGAGHLRAAEAVELAARSLDASAEIVNVDVLTHTTAAFRRIYGKAYLDLVNLAPHVLGWFYDVLDKAPSPRSRRDRLRMLVQRANLRGFNDVLLGESVPRRTKRLPREDASVPWDAVVCTHFLPAEIIARLRRKKLWPMNVIPVHTVVTDFDAHGLWVNTPNGEQDRFFVATDEASITLQRWGVPRETIIHSGIPIHPKFAEPRDQHECRRKHGLSLDRPVVLLLAGGFGVGPIEQLFEAALTTKVDKGIHLCAVCGKNEKLKTALEKVKVSSLNKATAIGFTREMDELMAAAEIVISKPGGLTTSEVLAQGAAMAIVNPIPGQESRNSDFLLEHGAAVKINSVAMLPHKLEGLLNDSARLKSLRTSAKSLGHPRAAFDVAEALLSGLKSRA